ncbi:MAG: hypothetical protein J6B04_06625 [Clostridia bacterium]|nr:hypothetical protein [Clostridia bacterium]
MKEITLKFNLSDSEYFTALRLVAGSVCSIVDIDIDTIEDFKVCITESALILKNCGFEEVLVTFSPEKGVVCSLEGLNGSPCSGENSLSLALIGALVSEFEIKENDGVIKRVTLKI